MLEIKRIFVSIGGKEILKGTTLNIKPGETHALIGPNGCGKSTLANILLGHPGYKVTSGEIVLNKKNITKISPSDRAKLGLFLAFQHPIEVPGVNFTSFLRLAYNSSLPKNKQLSVFNFRNYLRKKLALLDISEEFMERNVNEGFSGGEKKKAEILQLAVLEPKFAILDETDSGLDIDALKIVLKSIQKIKNLSPQLSILLISHNQKIFDSLKPDYVHLMQDGRIIENGGIEVIKRIEKFGYRKNNEIKKLKSRKW